MYPKLALVNTIERTRRSAWENLARELDTSFENRCISKGVATKKNSVVFLPRTWVLNYIPYIPSIRGG
jgi:hypothetical protein